MNILFHKTMQTSIGNIELITAKHSNHYFPKHFHETFPFGVVTRGALGFHYRGEKVTAWRGTINLANPGEVHDGFPAADNGWQYRMFYVDLDVLKEVLSSGQKQDSLPWFKNGVIRNQNLSAKIAWLHHWIENNAYSELEAETQISILLDELFMHHAQQSAINTSTAIDKTAFRPIIEQMRENNTQTFTLKQMAETCGFSVGYFIRAFKKTCGLTPHQFQLVCRMEHARGQILEKKSLTRVAIENGFVDQSHFQKTFKRFYGYTPAVLQSS